MNKHCTYSDWTRCRWGINYGILAAGVFGNKAHLNVIEIGVGPLEISCLPYFHDAGHHCIGVEALPDTAARLPQALMIARARPEPTGDDRTFWVTDSAMPETRLVEVLGLNGLAAAPLISTGGLKLMMIAGYVQADDGRLDGLPGTLTGVIGAAPLF
jgi:hypothetical protein